jgi:hypothetical protein
MAGGMLGSALRLVGVGWLTRRRRSEP